MSNRGLKIPKAPKKIRTTEKKSRISVWAIVSAAATLLGVLAAAVTFLPRLTVTISDPPDLENAFSALVTVTNSGSVPLDSVATIMGVGEICTQGAPCSAPDFPDPMRVYKTRFQRTQMIPRHMALDDHFTLALDDIARAADEGGLVYADVAVVVEYRVPYIPWKSEKTFPLYTRKASNGKLYWQWK
jgi:hypothetical protein